MPDESNVQYLPTSGVFRGIVSGTARIRSGSDIEVKGIIGGDLVIEPGSRVVVSGIVKGRVIDRGAEVKLTGIIGG